jgi:hypothetical protein
VSRSDAKEKRGREQEQDRAKVSESASVTFKLYFLEEAAASSAVSAVVEEVFVLSSGRVS